MKPIIAALAATITLTAQAAITGAGATFPAPVYFKWAEQYKQETGIEVNYQAIGSSGGIKQIGRKTVDFGASDVARSEADLKKDGQVQFPTVMGGVVVVVNLPGVEKNQINLTTDQVARLFSGSVKNWKEIDASLPDMPVTVAHRSDGSGTTSIFTNYLASNSKEFKLKPGKAVKWEGNTMGGKGNAGVAAMVTQIKGAVGYVEYAFAKQNDLTTTTLNGVAPSADTFKSGDWAITAQTFIIVYPNGENTKAVYKFFEWAYNNDQIAEELDYVPLSDKTKNESRKLWQ
jgi:phosphate transport system substrate-binding protein